MLSEESTQLTLASDSRKDGPSKAGRFFGGSSGGTAFRLSGVEEWIGRKRDVVLPTATLLVVTVAREPVKQVFKL